MISSNLQSSKIEKKDFKIMYKQAERLSARSVYYGYSNTVLCLPDIGSHQQRASSARLQAQQSKISQTTSNPNVSTQSKELLEIFKQFVVFKELTQASKESEILREEKPEVIVQKAEENRYYFEENIRRHIRQKLQQTGNMDLSSWITFILESPLLKAEGYRNIRNYETFLKVIKDIEDSRNESVFEEAEDLPASLSSQYQPTSKLQIPKQKLIKPDSHNFKVFLCLFQFLKYKKTNQLRQLMTTEWLQLIKNEGFQPNKSPKKDRKTISNYMSGLIALSLVSEGEQPYHFRWEGMENFRLPYLQQSIVRGAKSGQRSALLLISAFRSNRRKEWWSNQELFEAINKINFESMNSVLKMFESFRLIRRKIDLRKQLFAWNLTREQETLRGWELWYALNPQEDYVA